MKKLALIAFVALSFVACNVSVKTGEDTDAKNQTAVTEQPATEGVMAKKTDPVCGMEKGDTWTEFSVANKDTTWFCSPHCKESFDKDPAKYLNKKEADKKG